jgi:alpha-tubulin suppressor-like RCC1 family protein
MQKVRAGSFSAALSCDNDIYVWGEGSFGAFYSPHRIKSTKKMDVQDVQISRGGTACIVTLSGSVYSWGPNEVG